MKASSSTITSLLLALLFLVATLLQSMNAHAEQPNIQTSTATSEVKPLHIVGITENIQLNNIRIVWQEFKDSNYLHKKLKTQPKKIYALYNNFSDNFKQADITIGYSVDELSQFSHHTSIDISNSVSILPLGKYSEQQFRQAWKKVNYRKPIKHILEIHNMTQANKVKSAQMFVVYE